MRRSSTLCASLAVAGLMTAVAGCSSDATSPPSTVPASTVPITRVDDGVLTIGVLIPQGSANADIGEAIRSAVLLAVTKINAADGYGGAGVVLVNADEGVAGVGVDPAIATLLEQSVDAIIGPASSSNALAGLGEIVDAGVVSCSPTASASLLDDFPDQNLFFRTIPSDSLQALAIAEAVDRTGASRATVAYIDDAYGQSFLDSVEASLRQKGIEQSEAVPYSADNQSIAAAANRVAAMRAGVVVVIGDATSGPVMMGAIDAEPSPTRPAYVINDAMRRPTASAEPMGGSLASRVTGTSPVAYSTDQQFLLQLGATPDNPSPYAANAFDCVNLIALAALAAGSTLPAVIAAQIPAVSDSGTPCTTFADCREDIEAGSNINYDGPGGPLTVASNGDLGAAVFELFGFDEAGHDFNKDIVSVRA
ncbi:MAG: ABC transporter substrate-binding protein [Actinomycetota bacterium]|nr:ABC transporter substrate-binding protein [Actinomycetota bacterium]